MPNETQNGPNGVATYKAFGLTVSSCIALPELRPGAGGPQVTVRYGATPAELPGATQNGAGYHSAYQSAPGQLLLDVHRFARFLVRGGNEIVIDRQAEATDDDVRLFLLGPAFAALLHQRGILTLHGSTIQVQDGCVVFLGKYGMGKSTLATELVRRGYACLGDDICAISFGADGQPYALPAFPQARLWPQSLEQFGIDPNELRRIRPSRDKRCLPLERFSDAERLPVRRLYVLSYPTHDPELTVKPMTGPPRIRVLRDNTYRVEFLPGLDQAPRHFQQIVHLASRVSIVRAFRKRKASDVKALARVVENDFLSECVPQGACVGAGGPALPALRPMLG
ncbi:MAG TPA: hypothetical protein VJ739_15440 [Gemmataceae bacterium]|nr:hypothetical protein [Gemmataceae bacterium]